MEDIASSLAKCPIHYSHLPLGRFSRLQHNLLNDFSGHPIKLFILFSLIIRSNGGAKWYLLLLHVSRKISLRKIYTFGSFYHVSQVIYYFLHLQDELKRNLFSVFVVTYFKVMLHCCCHCKHNCVFSRTITQKNRYMALWITLNLPRGRWEFLTR